MSRRRTNYTYQRLTVPFQRSPFDVSDTLISFNTVHWSQMLGSAAGSSARAVAESLRVAAGHWHRVWQGRAGERDPGVDDGTRERTESRPLRPVRLRKRLLPAAAHSREPVRLWQLRLGWEMDCLWLTGRPSLTRTVYFLKNKQQEKQRTWIADHPYKQPWSKMAPDWVSAWRVARTLRSAIAR